MGTPTPAPPLKPLREFASGAVTHNSVIICCDRVLAHTKPSEYVCAWTYLAASMDVCLQEMVSSSEGERLLDSDKESQRWTAGAVRARV